MERDPLLNVEFYSKESQNESEASHKSLGILDLNNRVFI
jgi:hypothetical protein